MTLVPKTSGPPICDLGRDLDGPRLRPPTNINAFPYLWDLYPYLSSLEEFAARRKQLVTNSPLRWEWPMFWRDYFAGERVVVDDKGFRVYIDVGQFKPSEIEVTTEDRHVSVAAHQARQVNGFSVVERHFNRKYVLPSGFNIDHVTSDISTDGILTIKAPPPPPTRFDSTLARLVRAHELNRRALPWRYERF